MTLIANSEAEQTCRGCNAWQVCCVYETRTGDHALCATCVGLWPHVLQPAHGQQWQRVRRRGRSWWQLRR